MIYPPIGANKKLTNVPDSALPAFAERLSIAGFQSNELLWAYQDFAAGVITGTSATLTLNQNGTDALFDPSTFYNHAQIVRSDDPTQYVKKDGLTGYLNLVVAVSLQNGATITLNRIPRADTPCRIYWLYRGKAPEGYTLPPQNILDAAAAIKLDGYFVSQDEIVDNLTSVDSQKVLSAAQGKALNDGKQEILTATNFGAFANGLTAKTTPVDADSISIVDSSDSSVQKKVTWLNVKATLKAYYDTLFQPIDPTLTALAGLSTATGLVVQTGTDTFTKRQITGTTNYVNVTNGGGVGNDINIGMSIGGNAPSGNMVDQNTAQTLTNKTLTDSTTYFQDNSDNTKKMQLELSGITTNTIRTLKVPDISAGTGSKVLVVQDSLNLSLYGANGNNVIDTNVIPEGGGANKYYTDARVQTYVQGAALTYSQIQSFSKSIAVNSGIGIQAQSIVGAFDIDATAYNTPGVYCNRSGQTISNLPAGMPTPLAVILWSFTDDINNNGGATSIVQYLYSCSSDTPYIYIRSKYSNHAKSAWVQISPSGVPVGTLIEYSANSVPTGFLLANGASVSRTTYAALFAVIGTTFGAGDGSTTFQVPDARGLFLRGYGTNSNGWASGSFGTKIGDSFASHTHSVTDPGHTHAMTPAGHWYYSGTAGRIQNFYTTGYYAAEAAGSIVSATTGIAINSTGGTETAPKHIAVSICIKY